MGNGTTSMDFIVVIPCYNDTKGLISALESVTYNGSFLVLVVDDGSDEPINEAALKNLLGGQATIKVLTLSSNAGITRALNAGLNWITEHVGKEFSCEYVARLDCGDLCAPDRFTKQVAFLNANEDVGLLGTWCVFEDFETGDKFVYRTPTEDKDIRRSMYFRNIFIHPTVMWRMKIMKTVPNYPTDFPHAEDYGLFYQWIDRNVKTAVIAEKLVTCKINSKGLSLANRNHQLQSRLKVVDTYGKNRLLKCLGILKLKLLMALPYPLIFRMKKLLAAER